MVFMAMLLLIDNEAYPVPRCSRCGEYMLPREGVWVCIDCDKTSKPIGEIDKMSKSR